MISTFVSCMKRMSLIKNHLFNATDQTFQPPRMLDMMCCEFKIFQKKFKLYLHSPFTREVERYMIFLPESVYYIWFFVWKNLHYLG